MYENILKDRSRSVFWNTADTPFNSDNKNGRKGDALTNESILRRKNTLTKEIESWKGFTDTLKSEEDRKLP